MKVGIKYCGGCNPRYDRSQLLARIKEDYGTHHEIEIAREGVTYDALLVIGGCTNCCAQFGHYTVTGEILGIKSPDDYDKILHLLASI